LTLPEFLLVILACVILMRACPKSGPRPKKKRKPIPLRGRLKRRAVALRSRPPSVERVAYARQCQDQNLMQSRNAQPTIATCDALAALGIGFRREEITWYDGDLYVLSDFWLPELKVTIELDGSHHRFQHINDSEKAAIIREQTGFSTLRFWNAETLKPDFRQKLKVKLGL
jgi:hypothetical protein